MVEDKKCVFSTCVDCAGFKLALNFYECELEVECFVLVPVIRFVDSGANSQIAGLDFHITHRDILRMADYIADSIKKGESSWDESPFLTWELALEMKIIADTADEVEFDGLDAEISVWFLRAGNELAGRVYHGAKSRVAVNELLRLSQALRSFVDTSRKAVNENDAS